MAWIVRDKTGANPYRLFGLKPVQRKMVDYSGETLANQFTWTIPAWRDDGDHYGPLSNDEPTVIFETASPIVLEPGEGPIEITLSLKSPATQRVFEGAGI